MGLLQKADSFTSYKKTKTGKHSGLLNKTLEILYQTDKSNIGKSGLITQEEIDRTLANYREEQKNKTDSFSKPKLNAKKPNIPLKWHEVSEDNPLYKGPHLKQDDIDNLLANGKKAQEIEQEAKRENTDKDILQEIDKIPEGIETPVFLFAKLRKLFGINKGAILLYDPLHMVFAPWASHGYDATTLHRLRIPLGATNSFNQLTNGNILFIEDDSKEEYKTYFSNREFALLEKIAMIPLIYQNKLNAILLITEINNEEKFNKKDIVNSFEYLLTHISGKIYNAREKKLQLLKELQPEEFQSLQELVKKDIIYANSIHSKLYLITLTFENLIKKEVENQDSSATLDTSSLDRFRINEDLIRILRSLFAGMGRVVQVKIGTYLVSIYKAKNINKQLIEDQLNYNIDFFFKNPEMSRNILGKMDLNIKTYPDNGKNEDEILAELL